MSDPDTVLLDTHVWLWLVLGDRNLGKKACALIEDHCRKTLASVCSISVWEIAMLEERKRIVLRDECAAWMRRALSMPGLSLQYMTPDIAIESTRLPGTFHGDPADRIIVATARILDATLVTKDQQLLHYGNEGHVRVLKV